MNWWEQWVFNQSDLAKLLRETTKLIWDDTSMTNIYALEALG